MRAALWRRGCARPTRTFFVRRPVRMIQLKARSCAAATPVRADSRPPRASAGTVAPSRGIVHVRTGVAAWGMAPRAHQRVDSCAAAHDRVAPAFATALPRRVVGDRAGRVGGAVAPSVPTAKRAMPAASAPTPGAASPGGSGYWRRPPIAVAPLRGERTMVSPPHDCVGRALRRGGDQRPRDRLAGARGLTVESLRRDARRQPKVFGLRRDTVQREPIVPDDAARDVRERRVRLRGSLGNLSAGDTGEIVTTRSRQPREEIRPLKQVGHVGDARPVGDARAAADHAQVVARHVGDREAVRRGRRQGSASRPAPHRENRFRTRFVAAMSRPEPSNSSWSTTKSDSLIARTGAPIRLDVPPERSTIATSDPRRPEAISAIFADASNEWRPGSGWSPRIETIVG